MSMQRKLLQVLSIIVILSMLFSGFALPPVSAQAVDGIERQFNTQTGKISFIGPENGQVLSSEKALGASVLSQDPAMALAKRFGPEFGLKDPEQDLKEIKADHRDDGRIKVRYQQNYEGIPVMGGELIVNTNERGDLYSINGEVSSAISVPTQPTIDAEQARQTALEAMAKWYQKAPEDFVVSEPELWIYDERLLQLSTRPIELVWRMEVRSANGILPVRELVLVNAQRGGVSLHFNEIDNVWTSQALSKSQYNTVENKNTLSSLTVWPLYFEIALDESRGWLYGSDSSGNKIDVISTTTLQLVKSINLVAGAVPKGIALSPDGSELAIAQSGAGSLLFVNPDTGGTVATIIPNVTVGPNKPWDVIYGRAGRLYSTGNPDSSGFEYIHVIDTNTHLEVSKSTHIVRSAPRLSISPDNNSLYANDANFSPQKIYKYDISTDTIPNPTSTPHTSTLSAVMHIVDPVNGYIFTDTGQVWSPDLKAKIGSTGSNGQVVFIPARNAIAVADSGSVAFVDADNFYTLSTYTLAGSIGTLAAQSDGKKVFVSTPNGIAAIDLTSFPPGTPGALPTGSLPYSDIIVDDVNNVIYGSNTTGHKIDVISTPTLQVIDEIRLNNGSSPKGMDLSPDGSELAVALSGSNQIAFIDTNSLTVAASVIPDASDAPFDVKYGRPGRLYSSGSPYSFGFEYIHVIDTTSYTNVSKSGFIVRAGPSLAISADNNYLLANEQFSPNHLYKFDVSTDTIPNPTTTPHTTGFTASTFLLLSDESKIFTNFGQVWSNPSNLSLSTQLGTFNTSGYLNEIQDVGLVAVLGSAGSIKFVDSTNYSIVSSITVPTVSTFGPSAVNSNESKLFLNTNNGIVSLDLDPTHAANIQIESGSNQSTPPQTQFSLPLKAKVQNYLGQPISDVVVRFTAPVSGASGTFANTHTNTSTAVTDSNGIATSSAFSANSINGSYVVVATVTGLANSANFQLSNGIEKVRTYTANNNTFLPGTFLCDQTQPNCTNGTNTHADAAHKYVIDTYALYATQHGRDSLDNNGMTIISSVHYSSNYANAFWDGEQIVYGDKYGYPFADDVVAHELTHGVTQYESNLFYYYQSGAINESFSDLWGEYYDQSNGEGTDGAGVKWQMGEDVSGQGPTRSMSNPPAFNDPDKMSSSYYDEGEDDNGGVHTNSGVNNKAVYLLVDGGTFNGKTVTALGWEKTSAIYYEVNTNLLISGSDYSDLYYALQQACSNLIGQKGITAGDCAEVKDAIDAVEMNAQPAENFNTHAPLCTAAGTVPIIAFADDVEAGTGKWTFSNGTYTRWQQDTPYGPYAQSGNHSLFADDYPARVTDASARLASFVVPNSAYLHFAQAYGFESGYNTGDPTFYNFDGGVLEYSVNGGSTWVDAGSLMEVNGYRGTLFTGAGNPLSGRSAFVGSSHGYISTRLNLASLAGKTITFRWRMGLDEAGFSWGWWVDNIKVYTCGDPGSFNDVPKSHWAWEYVERLYNARITGGCNTSPLQYCPENTVTRAQMAIFLLKGIHGSSYAPPAVGGSTGFGDVSTNYWAGAWIRQLAAEGITGGCGSGNYCPESPVTRDQMAVFLLRAKYGVSYAPPNVAGDTGFSDVLPTHWAAAWIKQLAAEGITGGCGTGTYCPNAPVTRAQMAVFLVRTFNLP